MESKVLKNGIIGEATVKSLNDEYNFYIKTEHGNKQFQLIYNPGYVAGWIIDKFFNIVEIYRISLDSKTIKESKKIILKDLKNKNYIIVKKGGLR